MRGKTIERILVDAGYVVDLAEDVFVVTLPQRLVEVAEITGLLDSLVYDGEVYRGRDYSVHVNLMA